MADKFTPWIHDYLTGIYQRLGANYFSEKPATKAKKVQLLAFRGTRPTPSDVDDGNNIWADVSDKAFTIPVVFTSMAVRSYKQCHPFEQCEKAVLSIKSFHPVLRRVPLRGSRGLTKNAEIILQCDSFFVSDTSPMDIWGHPAELDTSPDLKDWIHGLRRGGGGGNSFLTKKVSRKQPKPRQDQLVFGPNARELDKKSESKGVDSTEVISEHEDVVNVKREYDRWWYRHLGKDDQSEYLKKAPVDADTRQNDPDPQPADEPQDKSDSEASTTSRPLTDSWSPSPRNSRKMPFEPSQKLQAQSVVETPASVRRPKVPFGTELIMTYRARKISGSLDAGDSEPGDGSSYLSVPTRSQRPKKTIAPLIVRSKLILSGMHQVDVTTVSPEDRGHNIYLPNSPSRKPVSRKSITESATSSQKHSTTFISMQPHDPTSSFEDGFLSSLPQGSLRSVVQPLAADGLRRVPPPAQPNNSPINLQSTPKILAPNSDTSSQPFSHSQLQSQSWLLSQSQKCPPTQYHHLFSQSQPQSQSQSELHSQLPHDSQPNVSDQFTGQATEDKSQSEPSLRLPQSLSHPLSYSGVSQQAVTSAVNLPERDAGNIDDHDSLFSADEYDSDLSYSESQSSVLRENTENESLSVNPPDTQHNMNPDSSSDKTSDSDSEQDKQSLTKCSRIDDGSGTKDRNANPNRSLDPDDFETQADLFGPSQKLHSRMAPRSGQKRKWLLLGVEDLEEPRHTISHSQTSIIHHSPSAWAAPSFMRQTVARRSADPSGPRSRYTRPDETTSQQNKTVLGTPQRGNPHKSQSTSVIGETADEISSTRKKDTITTTQRTLSRKDADNQMERSVAMKRASADNQHHRPLKRGKGNDQTAWFFYCSGQDESPEHRFLG